MKRSVLHSLPCCHRKGEELFGEPWLIAKNGKEGEMGEATLTSFNPYQTRNSRVDVFVTRIVEKVNGTCYYMLSLRK